MRITRQLYQGSSGGESYIPLDEQWGMSSQYATPEVQEACLYTMSHLTPKESSELLSKIGWFSPSATALDNRTKGFRENFESSGQALLEQLRETESTPSTVKTMVCSMDGVNVLLNEAGKKRGRPAEKPGKEPEQVEKSAYKNAMVGSFSFYEEGIEQENGSMKIPRLNSCYVSHMPEDGAKAFKIKFEDEVTHFESTLAPQTNKVLLMDGARALWKYVDDLERFDDYEKLLDFYHASEHLSAAAEAIYGKKSPFGTAWYQKWKGKLKNDENAVDKLLSSLKYFRDNGNLSKKRIKDLQTQMTYFRNNRQRMDYAGFRERGLPIGSGPVEAACKTLVKARLGRSGMRWSRQGGQTILDLRTLVKSNRWGKFWEFYARKFFRKAA